ELEVDGLLNLDDFEDETGIELPDGPYETVAGFIVQRLGQVPQIGDTTVFDRYELSVRELDGRRIARVRVKPLPGAAQAGARAGPIRLQVSPPSRLTTSWGRWPGPFGNDRKPRGPSGSTSTSPNGLIRGSGRFCGKSSLDQVLPPSDEWTTPGARRAPKRWK